MMAAIIKIEYENIITIIDKHNQKNELKERERERQFKLIRTENEKKKL